MRNNNTKPAQDLAAGEIDGSSLFNEVSKMDVAVIRKSSNAVAKTIFAAIAASCFIGMMAWHVAINPMPKKGIADLRLAEIEALATEAEDNYICSSGGIGTMMCEVSTEAFGIKFYCKAECFPGYYACCNALQNKCQCRAVPSQ